MTLKDLTGPSTQAADGFGATGREGFRPGEPIAIVGMACRFPGASNLESFWQVLAEGRNTVTEGVPGSGGETPG